MPLLMVATIGTAGRITIDPSEMDTAFTFSVKKTELGARSAAAFPAMAAGNPTRSKDCRAVGVVRK